MYLLVKYNTQTDVYFPMVKRAVVDLAVTADWTPATGDTKVSKDGGAVANTTNNPAIASGSSWKLTLTASELSCKYLTVQIIDSATKAVEDQFIIVLTYGNASAFFIAPDYQDAVRFGLTALPNAAAEAAGGLYTRGSGAGQINQQANGQIDSNLARWLNTAPAALSASGYVQAMVLRWLTDNAAGTPDALSTNKVAADLKLWLASAPNALVSSRVDSSVGAMAANVLTASAIAADAIQTAKIQDGALTAAKFGADFLTADTITAAKIAPDAIGASELAADAVSEIAAAIAVLSAGAVADAVWDEAISGHLGAGSTGSKLNAAGGAAGAGAIEWVILVDDGADPIQAAKVWVSTDSAGSNVVAGALVTTSFGLATFMLDAGTYYAFVRKDGFNAVLAQSFVVS